MKSIRRAGIATRAVALAEIVMGLAAPAHASLMADSSVCTSYSSYGYFVGRACAYGDDSGQSTPVSFPGGSGVGSGVIAGGSVAGALQDYGVFHGFATAAGQGIAGLGDAGGTTSAARGIMSDVLTLTGGTGFGYLTLQWTVSGLTQLDGYRGAYADLFIEAQTRTVNDLHGSGSLVIREGGLYTIDRLPFFFGRPLDLSVSSTVAAASGYDAGGGAYAYFAAALFGHTSTLTGIFAVDASGRPIDDITITAASGTHYPVTAAPGDPVVPPVQGVPEPASGALLAAGLAIGWTRRRRAVARGATAADPGRIVGG